MNNGKRLIEKNHEFYSEIINNFTNDLKASMNESTHLSYTYYAYTATTVYYIPFFHIFFRAVLTLYGRTATFQQFNCFRLVIPAQMFYLPVNGIQK